MSKEFKKIIGLLVQNKLTKISIFAHINADPDSVVSAIGLKHLLSEFIPNAEITLYASSLSTLSKNLLEDYEVSFHQTIIEENIDAIFLCDANNPHQIGDFDIDTYLNRKVPIFVIDHHSMHEFISKTSVTIITDATSTAEIIASLYKELERNPSPDIATLLIAGILFDSRRFIYLSPSTFSIIEYLIGIGGDYDEALSTLHTTKSVSERIARLKGAARVKLHKENNIVFALSNVSTYESSVARALIELGADFSAVLANPEEEFRISFRCTKEFAQEKQVDLGELANELAENMGGSGGGHTTAAGLNFKKRKDFPYNKEDQMQYILDLI
ncbi:MAG: DHH family phosphoesterase, partial [Candidatus Heimdallarchaeaceae archaeon]